MMDFLTRIRSKPPLVRAQYALGIAAAVTGIVALIWLTTLPARFSRIGEELQKESNVVILEERVPVSPEPEPEPAFETGALDTLDDVSPQLGTTSEAHGAIETSVSGETASTSRVIQIGTTSQNVR